MGISIKPPILTKETFWWHRGVYLYVGAGSYSGTGWKILTHFLNLTGFDPKDIPYMVTNQEDYLIARICKTEKGYYRLEEYCYGMDEQVYPLINPYVVQTSTSADIATTAHLLCKEYDRDREYGHHYLKGSIFNY